MGKHVVIPLRADLAVRVTYAPPLTFRNVIDYLKGFDHFDIDRFENVELAAVRDGRLHRTRFPNTTLQHIRGGALSYKDGTWDSGALVRNLYEKMYCYRLMRSMEKDRKRKYAYFVYTRIDLDWLHDHPPLSVLRSPYIWIPKGSDWGGLNDRHAVVPRCHAEAYYLRYLALLTGEMQEWVAETRWESDPSEPSRNRHFLNGERLLDLTLRIHSIPVARFVPVAGLSESGGWRYRNELAFALQVSTRLENGGRWVFVKRDEPGFHSFQPDCTSWSECCDESKVLGGPPSCWMSDLYSFNTCCDKIGRSIQASVLLHEEGPSCLKMEIADYMTSHIREDAHDSSSCFKNMEFD